MSTSQTSGIETDLAGLAECAGRHLGYTPWQEMAETYLSYEHFKATTTPANEDEKISAEAV